MAGWIPQDDKVLQVPRVDLLRVPAIPSRDAAATELRWHEWIADQLKILERKFNLRLAVALPALAQTCSAMRTAVFAEIRRRERYREQLMHDLAATAAAKLRAHDSSEQSSLCVSALVINRAAPILYAVEALRHGCQKVPLRWLRRMLRWLGATYGLSRYGYASSYPP
ncbi:hypothetical protein ABZ626_03650 [Streptomyces longispororuber]|uniref:hypothetical protein n=1 Tax=Streptomyces longispororuber TaxID=68230 RepID=UPI0033D29DD5